MYVYTLFFVRIRNVLVHVHVPINCVLIIFICARINCLCVLIYCLCIHITFASIFIMRTHTICLRTHIPMDCKLLHTHINCIQITTVCVRILVAYTYQLVLAYTYCLRSYINCLRVRSFVNRKCINTQSFLWLTIKYFLTHSPYRINVKSFLYF